MVALWCIVGLVAATVSVSSLGAGFSIFGLSQLFSGASLAVICMASSLELAKFVLAAYLHQTWSQQRLIFKSYLSAAVVVLSVITSMGIFGFLSNAYQSASSVLEENNITISALRDDLARNEQEIARLNKAIDEIPVTRITKKMKARAEAEPEFAKLRDRSNNIKSAITSADLKLVDVKKKVGPLIYIARAFNVDIDQVVKYLILILVLVFDPLAICLVIATSQALAPTRKQKSSEAVEVVQMRFVDDADRPAS